MVDGIKSRASDEQKSDIFLASSRTIIMAISSTKRIDPLAATGLVSSNLRGSFGKITAPASQGLGFSNHDPSVKAKHDLSGASERNS